MAEQRFRSFQTHFQGREARVWRTAGFKRCSSTFSRHRGSSYKVMRDQNKRNVQMRAKVQCKLKAKAEADADAEGIIPYRSHHSQYYDRGTCECHMIGAHSYQLVEAAAPLLFYDGGIHSYAHIIGHRLDVLLREHHSAIMGQATRRICLFQEQNSALHIIRVIHVRVKVIPGTERPACAERVYQGRKYMLHGLLKVRFGHLLLYVLEG